MHSDKFKRLIQEMVWFIMPIIILLVIYLLLPENNARNIIYDTNLWKSQEWIDLQNPFDNTSMLVSRYGGSEIIFDITDSRVIAFKVTSSNNSPGQGIEVTINKDIYFLETPGINEKRLIIDLSKYISKTRVRVRHFCAGSTHPCDLAIREILVEKKAKISHSATFPKQTIAFLGDSISVGFNRNNFTYLLAEKMNMHLHNASIFGSRVGYTKNQDSALNRYYEDIVKYQPNYILITMGTNDLSDNVPLTKFTDDYFNLFKGIKSGCSTSKIIAVGIFYRKNTSISRIKEFDNVIRTTADYFNAYYIDPYTWLTDSDMLDAVHPKENVQEKIANHFIDFISNINKEL